MRQPNLLPPEPRASAIGSEAATRNLAAPDAASPVGRDRVTSSPVRVSQGHTYFFDASPAKLDPRRLGQALEVEPELLADGVVALEDRIGLLGAEAEAD